MRGPYKATQPVPRGLTLALGGGIVSWYADMGQITMIAAGEFVRAIGWLSDQHPFTTGNVPPEFLARLKIFCEKWQDGLIPLNWPIFMGCHTCELCGRRRSDGNIGVPAEALLYVAPDMIAHYVEVHNYLPPAEFIEAVLNAPLPGTSEYAHSVTRFRQFS